MYRSVQPTLLGALLATFAAAGCAREQGYRTTTAGAEMPPPGYQTEQYERIPTERGMEQRQAYPQRAPGYAEEPMPGQQGAYRPPQATPPAPPAGAQAPMAPNDERLHAELSGVKRDAQGPPRGPPPTRSAQNPSSNRSSYLPPPGPHPPYA